MAWRQVGCDQARLSLHRGGCPSPVHIHRPPLVHHLRWEPRPIHVRRCRRRACLNLRLLHALARHFSLLLLFKRV